MSLELKQPSSDGQFKLETNKEKYRKIKEYLKTEITKRKPYSWDVLSNLHIGKILRFIWWKTPNKFCKLETATKSVFLKEFFID